MSNVEVIISPKWFDEAVELVRNFDFEYVNTYYNGHRGDGVHNCQFCGQNIMYVAVIKGMPKNTTSIHPIEKHIGCDCVERILGTHWSGYHSMQRHLKDLKAIVTIEHRKIRYAEKYKEYIDFLNTLPDFVLEQNYFLRGMKKILTTGEKIFTPKMEEWLKKSLVDPRLKLAMSQHTDTSKQVKKMKELLLIIEELDGENIHDEKKSSYHFVNSVLNYTLRKNGATQKQLEALNNVFSRYMKRKETKKASISQMPAQASIPF